MMNLVPYRKIVVQTRVKPSEAVELLRQAVFTDLPPFLYIPGSTDYYAKITEDRFTAYRLSKYRNDFTAVVHGRFVPTSSGTDVSIKIYPPLVNVVVVIVLIGVLLFASLYSSYQWLLNGNKSENTLVLLSASVLIYIVSLVFYLPEAQRAEIFIKNIFQENGNVPNAACT